MNRLRSANLRKIPGSLRRSLLATLAEEGVGIFPTDTIYGIVASAFSRPAVERIYRLRMRIPKKPFIVLIASERDLARFGVKPTARQRSVMKTVWPGPASLIFPVPSGKFSYLTRGKRSLAFRLPKPGWLRDFLSASGPLVAPSANWEGAKPARNVAAARKYFGDGVDFYVSVGDLASEPSTLVSLVGKRPEVLRKGAFRGNLNLSACSKK